MDLNSDLGESFGALRIGDDDGMLAVVTSANVACGFHGGDPLTMLHALERSAANGIAVGAHVSYRDLAGFGRRELGASAAELRGDVLYQLAALDGMARSVGTRVAYVKPHGALYNRIAKDGLHATAVLDAMTAFDPRLGVLAQPGSLVARLAAGRGTRVHFEAFGDRGYADDGTLLPRSAPGALIADPAAVASRVVRLARDGLIRAASGIDLAIAVDSVCVHSDTPGATALALAARRALEDAGVPVASFVR